MLTTLLALALTITADCSAFSVPSWDQLQSPSSPLHRPLQTPHPIFADALPSDVQKSNELPILYRDKNCIDVASEIVWLALECKNVDYLTVLVDPHDESVPKIVWPDNDDDDTSINDPIELLEQIQSRYPTPSPFYPKISISVDASRSNIMRLPGVMPRNCDPELQSSSPFIFRADGTLVAKSSHCVSLEELEEMMEEYEGPYICGEDMTAADLVWITYLERYSVQLPLLYPKVEVLNPQSSAYEMVRDWCKAMEKMPAYSCQIRGDARHWRKCLEQSVDVHNSRSDEKVKLSPLPKRKQWWMKKIANNRQLWEKYCHDLDGKRIRPWLGDTPQHEAGLYLLRNREDIIESFVAEGHKSKEEVDESLRLIIQQLINSDDDTATLSTANSQKLLEFAMHKIEVPRDLGMAPAAALGELFVKMEENSMKITS